MVKGLHKHFNTVVNDLKNILPDFGESGSEVLHFIPEPMIVLEFTISPANEKKDRLQANSK